VPDIAPAVQAPPAKPRRDWLAIVPLVLGVIVETAQQALDVLTPLAATVPGVRWLPLVLGVCAVIVKVARRFGLLAPLALALLLFAAPTLAQVDEAAMDATEMSSGTDPGTVIADAVAQAAPDPRWSFKIGSVTVAASASFAPAVLSLSDLKLSIGPNVGAGADVTWTNGYGFAAHGAMRETTDGVRPLGAAFAILPFLQKYGVRPGVLYQFGGGAAPWRDGFMLAIAGASNFGFPSGL
jgi:hypothetical protein